MRLRWRWFVRDWSALGVINREATFEVGAVAEEKKTMVQREEERRDTHVAMARESL